MRPLPAPAPPRARVASVQRVDRAPSSVVVNRGRTWSSRAITAEYLRGYMDWQGWAKRYAKQLSVVRFAAGITADTIMRVEPRVEEFTETGEWVASKDPRMVGIIEEYRNPLQTHVELLRAHAWHYQIAGECAQVMRNEPTGVEWSIRSMGALEWDKPELGKVTVKDTPDGKVGDGTAFVVPREYVQRFWIPDEEWAAYATSPMAASLDDLHRMRVLARYAFSTADSQLAMAGAAWFPDDNWVDATVPGGDDVESNDSADPRSTVEDIYYDFARLRLSDSDDVTAAAPPMFHDKKDAGPPQWIKFGEPLDPNGIAYRKEALEDFARGTNLPASLVVGGGPGDANHWTEWLVDQKFFDQAQAPTANRIFHVDITATFLAPRVKIAGLDPRRYRMGYDPTNVLVKADKSDSALRAYVAGLIGPEPAREAMGWDKVDAPTDEELAALLEVLSRRAQGEQQLSTEGGPPPGDGTSTSPSPPLSPPSPSAVANVLERAFAASLNGDS